MNRHTAINFILSGIFALVLPLAARAAAQPETPAPEGVTDIQITDFDPAFLPRLRFHPTPWLAVGALLKYKLTSSEYVNIQGSAPTHQRFSESGLFTAATVYLAPNLGVFTAGEVIRSKREGEDPNIDVGITAAYLVWSRMFSSPFRLQLGRQRFFDERQWLFDENLDGVRLQGKFGRLAGEISGSTYLNPKSDREELENYLVRTDFYFTTRNRLGAYAFHRKDPLQENNDRTYLGMNGEAQVFGHKLWLDAALLSGDNGTRRRQSFGADAGITLRLGADRQWSMTLAHALGSGDSNQVDNLDQTFRQTGLHDNQAQFDGITRFKYYGVVTDPELSNLRIATAGIGLNHDRRYSIDLVYHAYEQLVANNRFRSELIQDPNGEQRRLGAEIDVILGARIGKYFSVYGVAGVFQPGVAFDDANRVVFGEIELRLAAMSPPGRVKGGKSGTKTLPEVDTLSAIPPSVVLTPPLVGSTIDKKEAGTPPVVETSPMQNNSILAESTSPILAHYREEALQGVAAAQYQVGRVYEKGEEVPRNYKEALAWYRKAADQGYGPAQNSLGSMYMLGKGVATDPVEAYVWLSLAASNNVAWGQQALDYLVDTLTPAQLAEAKRKESLLMQNNTALAEVAVEAETKTNIPDFAKHRDEAPQEAVAAQYQLGRIYEKGEEVPRDYKEALAWYRKAANQGYGPAQHSLGAMYMLGKGVAMDPVEAYVWLSLAANNNVTAGQQAMDYLVDTLTPAQLAEAKRKVAAWAPQR